MYLCMRVLLEYVLKHGELFLLLFTILFQGIGENTHKQSYKN